MRDLCRRSTVRLSLSLSVRQWYVKGGNVQGTTQKLRWRPMRLAAAEDRGVSSLLQQRRWTAIEPVTPPNYRTDLAISAFQHAADRTVPCSRLPEAQLGRIQASLQLW